MFKETTPLTQIKFSAPIKVLREIPPIANSKIRRVVWECSHCKKEVTSSNLSYLKKQTTTLCRECRTKPIETIQLKSGIKLLSEVPKENRRGKYREFTWACETCNATQVSTIKQLKRKKTRQCYHCLLTSVETPLSDLKVKVIQELPTATGVPRRVLWACSKCHTVIESKVSNLIKKRTTQCGECLAANKRGLTREENQSLHNRYKGIKNRCYNEDHLTYDHYGGRGIRMCDEWLYDSSSFYDWAVRSGYHLSLEIDRIDNEGNYTPANCRWVTKTEQMENRRIKNKHGYAGVCWDNRNQKFYSEITHDNKTYKTKRYPTIIGAVLARNRIIKQKQLPHKIQILRPVDDAVPPVT